MNPENLRHGIEELMALYETEPEHVLHVRDLSLQLYDGLQPWHGLSAEDRLILLASSTLHDIGWKVTAPEGKGHHKESARMIREYDWSGLTRREVELMALTARYHRKATPSAEHEDYAALSAEDQRRVGILAACLRIGDALDRRHRQFVRSVRVRMNSEVVEILAQSPRELDEELEAAQKKGDLLEELFPGTVLYTWEIVDGTPRL